MTDDSGNGVRISNRDIYDEVVTLRNELAKAVAALMAHEGSTNAHGSRIRSLELKFYGILAGLLTGVGAVLWAVKP